MSVLIATVPGVREAPLSIDPAFAVGEVDERVFGSFVEHIGATLTEVTNFGTNPTNLRMYLYVPDRVAAQPAILVAIHYCTGTGPAFYSGTSSRRWPTSTASSSSTRRRPAAGVLRRRPRPRR